MKQDMRKAFRKTSWIVLAATLAAAALIYVCPIKMAAGAGGQEGCETASTVAAPIVFASACSTMRDSFAYKISGDSAPFFLLLFAYALSILWKNNSAGRDQENRIAKLRLRQRYRHYMDKIKTVLEKRIFAYLRVTSGADGVLN